MVSRILINATILNDPKMSGLGIYAHNLLSNLLPLLREDTRISRVTLIGDSPRIAGLLGDEIKHEKIHVDHVGTNHPLVRLLALNRRAYAESTGRGVLFYSPTHHGVVVKNLPQVITIHDLFARIFPKNYPMQSYYFKFYLPHVLSSTRVVISDSQSTANDLRKYYQHVPETSVVYAATRADLKTEPPEAIPGLVGEKFFLFVGPSYEYKNADRLIDAFALLNRQHKERPCRLVFAGGRETYVDRLKRHIGSACPALEKHILFLGYVSSEELAWLYQHALATMITTLYEGFGLPALEAMRLGCPVVASRVASLPEVCAEAALYVDPYSVAEIADAMEKLSADRVLIENLRRLGYQNLRRFDWKLSARQVLDVFEQTAD